MPAILWFEDISISDVPLVGGKNASLGEMVRELGKSGVRVPSGFATTAEAYRAFIEANAIGPAISDQIARLHSGKASLQEVGQAIRETVLSSRITDELQESICGLCGAGFTAWRG